jgi:hypothetical protein
MHAGTTSNPLPAELVDRPEAKQRNAQRRRIGGAGRCAEHSLG